MKILARVLLVSALAAISIASSPFGDETRADAPRSVRETVAASHIGDIFGHMVNVDIADGLIVDGAAAPAEATISVTLDTNHRDSLRLELVDATGVIVDGADTDLVPDENGIARHTIALTPDGDDVGQAYLQIAAVSLLDGRNRAEFPITVSALNSDGRNLAGANGIAALALRAFDATHNIGPDTVLEPGSELALERGLVPGTVTSPSAAASATVASAAALGQLPDDEFDEAESAVEVDNENGFVPIDGVALWTDADGNTHPISFARVEVQAISPRTIYRITSTDAFGRYSTTIAQNCDGDCVAVVVYSDAQPTTTGGVRVAPSPNQPTFSVSSEPFGIPAGAASYTVDDIVSAPVPDELLAIEINGAFSTHQAIQSVRPLGDQLGLTTGQNLEVEYPRSGSSSSGYELPSPQYPLGRVLIGSSNALDWDVIHHEYGHLIGNLANIESSPGGPHAINENLALRLPLDNALRLAWSEGWATFFGTYAQTELNLAQLGVPEVGDRVYQDPNFRVELESPSDELIYQSFPDNELTIFRTLWDLYDGNVPADELQAPSIGLANPTEPFDRVALLEGLLDSLLSLNDPGAGSIDDFYDAWYRLVAPLSPPEVATLGCLASQAGAAPQLIAPLVDADGVLDLTGAEPETLGFLRGGASPADLASTFLLEFWSPGYENVIFSASLTEAELGVLGDQPAASHLLDIAEHDVVRTLGEGHVLVSSNFRAPGTARMAGCGLDYEATPSLQIDFASTCLSGNGRFDVAVENLGETPRTLQFEVEQIAPRTKVIDPGETRTFTVTGRIDGVNRVSVSEDVIGRQVQWFDAEPVVACDPPAPEVVVRTSCLADYGRIDVLITNEGPSAVYTVRVDQVVPKTAVVTNDTNARVSITGRPDGQRLVNVRRNGNDIVFDQFVTVLCDYEPDGEAAGLSTVRCFGGDGRFDVYLNNYDEGDTVDTFVITVSGMPDRTRTVRAGDTVIVPYTGRPDRGYDIEALRDDEPVFTTSVDVACDAPD